MNQSNICQVPLEELAPLVLHDVPVFVTGLQAAVVVVICTVALVLNFIVGMVISVTKDLHIRPFILCLQIPILNFLQSLTRGPATLVSSIFHSWKFGAYGCQAVGLVSLLLDMCRWLILFTITLDRFLSIFLPFNYPKIANWFVLVLSITFWVGTIIYSFVPLIKFGCYTFSGMAIACSLQWACTDASCASFFVVTAGLVYFLGGLAPVGMNVMMLYRAWKLRRSVAPGQFGNEQNQEYQQQIIKRDLRALMTFFALFISCIGLTLPFFVNGFARALTVGVFETSYAVPVVVSYLLHDIYYLITVTDPLILSWNQDVKKAIKRAMQNLPTFGMPMCHQRAPPPPSLQTTTAAN